MARPAAERKEKPHERTEPARQHHVDGRGAFEERVDYEMDKVIQNILDPNTKATAKRKITLTIELTPDDERRHHRASP